MDTDPGNPGGTRAWVAEAPAECYSCAVLHGSEQEWAKDERSPWLIHTTALVDKRPRLRSR